ncbi:MAG TPA: glycosyltransferase family 4 protein [Candidatus Paceibacterota bacterium]|jgi:glycosyltransferase involved in cell wall biosynthesis|nr:glycosyltransferase family 4 protein [Candidatus Paceibacterota bacterium]
MSKRILVFSTAYLPFVGGAEVAIKEIAGRLGGEYEFDLIAARYARNLPKTERIGVVTVHRIGPGIPILDKLWVPWGGALEALKLHRQHGYGLFWCMMATYASGAAYIANSFLRPRVPVLLTLQEGDSERYLRRKWAGLVDISWRLALRRANAVSVISRYLGARAKKLGFRGEPVLIPNAVNTKHFAGPISSEERARMRASLGLKDDDVALVTTSRLVYKNACDDAIKALALLPENVHFIIYGIGPDGAMLRELAKKEGVSARTHFMGQIGHAEMPTALKSCDIFIRPSRSEGMGNSFIEAMAANVPVIATQEGGIADFLFDAKRNPGKEATGWAVDKDSPQQIAAAVRDILANPEKVARVTASANALVIKKYDWDLVAASMRGLFDRMFAKG